MKKAVWPVVIVVSLLVCVAGVFAFSLGGKYEKVKENNGLVSLPLARFADGKAHFFKYREGGKDVSFFVVKASDGSYRTAFDACDVCFQAKKGYVQQGDVMVCTNCNQKFATNRIGPHEVGGCNPSYLPATVSGSNITFKAQDLKQGARFF